MRDQRGQIVLVLILVMTVALAIGLSVVQRSLSDISTASKAEQSSRAYSAAEAGIEKAILSNSNVATLNLGNNAAVEVVKNDIPFTGQAMEYPPLSKEDIAHVWLADPTSATFPACSSGLICYSQPKLDIYWGVPNTISDKPALEITIIHGSSYQASKFFLDPDSTRVSANGFTDVSVSCNNPVAITTSLGSNRTFFCKYQLGVPPNPVLLRARILYSSVSQPFAAKPLNGTSDCADIACSLPAQAKLFTATGQSGQTQRKVQVFRLDKVVPSFFDYAIFSAGEISK